MGSRLVSFSLLRGYGREEILLTWIVAPYWSNNEWRSYTFKDGSPDLQEDEESIARREVPN